AGPYQLLIVGDALCQPWAKIPKVVVDGVVPEAEVVGVIKLTPNVVGRGIAVDHYELFIDGRRAGAYPQGQEIEIDTMALTDGWHEVRVVAIAAGPMQTQGRAIIPIQVRNRDRKVLL